MNTITLELGGRKIRVKAFCDTLWIRWWDFLILLNYKSKHNPHNLSTGGGLTPQNMAKQQDCMDMLANELVAFDKEGDDPGKSAGGKYTVNHITLSLALTLTEALYTTTSGHVTYERKTLAKNLHRDICQLIKKREINLKALAKKRPAGSKAEPKVLTTIPSKPVPKKSFKPGGACPVYVVVGDIPSLDYIRGRLDGNRFSAEQQNSVVWLMKKTERLEETILELAGDLKMERITIKSLKESGPQAELLKKIAAMTTDKRVSDVGFRHTAHTLAIINA